jgi:hypothetical protein
MSYNFKPCTVNYPLKTSSGGVITARDARAHCLPATALPRWRELEVVGSYA